MNLKHIESTFTDKILESSVNGVRLLTNGYFAFAAPPDFLVAKRDDYPNLARMWRDALGQPVSPLAVGPLFASTPMNREIGNARIAERYVRCFPDVTWSWSFLRGAPPPLLAHRDGALVAIVMQCRTTDDDKLIESTPSDELVFGPHACPDNGWYLIDAKTKAERVRECQIEIDKAQDRIEEAEQYISTKERMIAAIRGGAVGVVA